MKCFVLILIRQEKARMKQELDKQKNQMAREKQRQKQVVLR